jgi:hypothetical protein
MIDATAAVFAFALLALVAFGVASDARRRARRRPAKDE